MDKISTDARSKNMSAIRGKNTKPELTVRKMLHAMGYRFRLHRKDLPGNPDIVFPGRLKAIQVHGCFWHQHPNCREGRIPSSRHEYWKEKLSRNVARDGQSLAALGALGWDVLVIWECETGKDSNLANRLVAFLGPPGRLGASGT